MEEAFVVSDSGSKEANCIIYDIETLKVIDRFRESNSRRNGLAFIGHDYLISALADRPALKVWTTKQNDREELRITTPKVILALAVSKCGYYCIGAAEKAIYFWDISSGNLLNILTSHLQPITCLRFSTHDSHFISGGKDGFVFVWLFSDAMMVTKEDEEGAKPCLTWNDHNVEISDIFVSRSDRIVSTAKDMSCRIYDLATGLLETSVYVTFPITAVTMDSTESFLFLGSYLGDIHRINLFKEEQSQIHYEEVAEKAVLSDHRFPITCISVSKFGTYLVSGAEDGDCTVWDLNSFSIKNKISCCGPVTNAFFISLPRDLQNEERKPQILVNVFKRLLTHKEDEDSHCVTTMITGDQKLSFLHLGDPEECFDPRIFNCSTQNLEHMLKENKSLEEVSRINKSIYAVSLSECMVEAGEDISDEEISD